MLQLVGHVWRNALNRVDSFSFRYYNILQTWKLLSKNNMCVFVDLSCIFSCKFIHHSVPYSISGNDIIDLGFLDIWRTVACFPTIIACGILTLTFYFRRIRWGSKIMRKKKKKNPRTRRFFTNKKEYRKRNSWICLKKRSKGIDFKF